MKLHLSLPIALLVSLSAAGELDAAMPLIIAHRGASRDAPENTLASIKLGFEQGADFVETDLYLTADDRIVLIHDATTKRTGDVDLKIADSTLAELKQLDVGKWKGDKWAGERIPTLEEALELIPRGKGMFLELKAGPEIVPALAKVLKAAALPREQLVIISFNLQAVIAAKQELPEYRTQWIVGFKPGRDGQGWQPEPSDIIAQARSRVDGLDLKACQAVDAALVAQAKAANLPVYVWTVNDLPLANATRAAGVLGITTDRPGWLREQWTRASEERK